MTKRIVKRRESLLGQKFEYYLEYEFKKPKGRTPKGELTRKAVAYARTLGLKRELAAFEAHKKHPWVTEKTILNELRRAKPKR
jgi:hypothetical protein